MRRGFLFLAGLLLFLPLVSAQVITLNANEVFIQNYETVPLSNDLVNVPISFPDQTYVSSQLSGLQLRNAQETLDTQIIPTSYYKTENGSGQAYVKTAIARVLFSSGPGTTANPLIQFIVLFLRLLGIGT